MILLIDQALSHVTPIIPVFIYLYLASLGNSLVERSGILNLAIDGAYTLGVALAFVAAASLGDPTAALLATSVAVGLLGVLIAFLTTKLPVSHGAVGLSIQFVGYGVASFLAYPTSIRVGRERLSLNTYLPTPGVILAFLVTSLALGFFIHFLLFRTKLGVAVRAVGENPAAAASLGTDVLRVRAVASLVGYALIGAASSTYILLYTKGWQEGAGMGQGWISFAISLSSGRHPIVGMLMSLIFASLIRYAYVLQDTLIAYGINVSNYIVVALPFTAAIAIPVIVSAVPPLRKKFSPPKSLGKIFFSEERSV